MIALIVRLIILIIATSLLTSCIHETKKQTKTLAYCPHTLNVAHTYRIPVRSVYLPWWNKFHDPQLNRLIRLGLKDSPNIKIAKDRLQQAKALTTYTSAKLYPAVNLTAYEQRQRFSKFGIVPPPFNGETFNVTDIGLNFNYEFDFWGKNRESVAAQVSETCALRAELATARLMLSTAIATTYFQLQNNLAQLNLAQSILNEERVLLKITSVRNKHDIIDDIPFITAKNNVHNAEIAIHNNKLAVQLSRNRLAVLIGKNPLKTTIVMPHLYFRQQTFKLPASIPANLLANRPDILAARYRTEALSHKINVAKALFFPNINLMGLFSYQTIKFGELFTPETQNNYIMGALDLPIFDAGARRANVDVRYQAYSAAVNQYNQTILTALNQVADQLSLLRKTRAQLQTQNAKVRELVQNQKLIQSQYRHGIIEYENFIVIHDQLLQQQAEQMYMQTQHLQAIVGLYHALGGYDKG